MNEYITLVLGVILAGLGGELFVRSVLGLARWARVSPGIVAATVAAFATSSPELTVSITAAMAGTPRIALGDALGSNVVNVALILGIALSVSGFRTEDSGWGRDFTVASMIPVMTGLMLIDGLLSRMDALILLGGFVLWFFLVLREAQKQRRSSTDGNNEHHPWFSGAQCAIGLVLLVAAGRLFVTGATAIAVQFGIDPFVIGATIVALGTSVPEIATTLIATLRGHHAVGFGTILGSNIFNGLFVVAVASLISPISVNVRELAVVLGFGLSAMALVFPGRGVAINRRRGVLLLALYALYLFTEIEFQRA